MKKTLENKSILISLLLNFIFYCFIFILFSFTFKQIKPIFQTEGKGKSVLIILEQPQSFYSNQTESNKQTENTKQNSITKKTNAVSDNTEESFLEHVEFGKGNYIGSTQGNYKTQIDNYLDNQIKEKLFYPEKAKIRGIEGKVIIKLNISSEGILSSSKIISSSGSKILDNAALQLLSSIFPLPQTKIQNINLQTTISIDYKLM